MFSPERFNPKSFQSGCFRYLLDWKWSDYDQLEMVSNQFSNQANMVSQMLQNVNRSMSSLESGGWIGRGSDAFFGEMHNIVLPASQRLYEALEEANRVTKD